MKLTNPHFPAPKDGDSRKAIKPVVCYPPETLTPPPLDLYNQAKDGWNQIDEVLVPARDARTFRVPAGHFFRIISVNGPQVGDLNIWNADNLEERFYTGKTRALHGTHLSTGDRLWSSFPYLRPLATITADTLDWYGFDEFGGSVHDVIGTRCDPYTNKLLSGDDYHYCCHSNLSRALFDALSPSGYLSAGLKSQPASIAEIEHLVHDVLNVFMCTGFDRVTGQYFMKHTPVRPGDYLEFFAEIDLLGGLSACPGGACDAEHSSDVAVCHPLLVQVFAPQNDALQSWKSPHVNAYDQTHGYEVS